jgi:hypothetical protein
MYTMTGMVIAAPCSKLQRISILKVVLIIMIACQPRYKLRGMRSLLDSVIHEW